MKPFHRFWLVAGLMLIMPAVSGAQNGYNIQVLARGGDTIGGVTLASSVGANMGAVGVNDAGEALFFAQGTRGRVLFDAAGGKVTPIFRDGDRVDGVPVPLLDVAHPTLGPTASGQTLIPGADLSGHTYLFQYAAGRMSLILAPGAAMPGGHWSSNGQVGQPLSMNAAGVVLFAAEWTPTGALFPSWGVFRWDPATRQITPTAVVGMQTTDHQTITAVNGYEPPVINNYGEIVFSASVKDAAGKQTAGLFFMDAHGNLQTIVQDGAALPDGHTYMGAASDFNFPGVVLNDVKMVAFRANVGAFDRNLQDTPRSCYLWWSETGTIRATGVATGAMQPGGTGPLGRINAIALNRTWPGLLVEAQQGDLFGDHALYLCTIAGFPADTGASIQQAAGASPLDRLKMLFNNAKLAVQDLLGLSILGLHFDRRDYKKSDFLPVPPYQGDVPQNGGSGEPGPSDPFSAAWVGPVIDNNQDRAATALFGWGGTAQPVTIGGTSTPAGTIQTLGSTYSGYIMGVSPKGRVLLPADLSDPAGAIHEAVLLLTPASTP